jgi:glycosyltransferase involved in cell wall biosynthesis
MKIDFFKRFRDQFSSFKSFNLFDTQARRLISSGHFENPEKIKKPEKHDNIPPVHKLKSLLFVTGIFPDILHGGGLRIYDFITALNERNVNIDLFTVAGAQYSKNIIPSYKRRLRRLKIAKDEDFNSRELETFIGRKKYDYIIVVWPWTASIISPKLSKKNKIIFDFIECTTKRTMQDILLGRITIKKVKFFLETLLWELKACSIAKGLIFVTREDKLFAKKYLKVIQKSTVVSSYISSNFSRLKNKCVEKSNSVCFIGNYDHYPNIDAIEWYIKKIHINVLKAIPTYKFYIIGSVNLNSKRLDRLLSKYKNFSNSIIYIGFVKEANEELAKYQIAVSPLISGAGFRGKLIQYSILSKPIVATSLSCAGLPLKHGGNILIADDAKSFSDNVVALLRDKSLQKKISKNAYDLISVKYTWESNIDRIISELSGI